MIVASFAAGMGAVALLANLSLDPLIGFSLSLSVAITMGLAFAVGGFYFRCITCEYEFPYASNTDQATR